MHSNTLLLPILILEYTQIQVSQEGIVDTVHPSRGLRQKSEIDHIDVVESKAIEISV